MDTDCNPITAGIPTINGSTNSPNNGIASSVSVTIDDNINSLPKSITINGKNETAIVTIVVNAGFVSVGSPGFACEAPYIDAPIIEQTYNRTINADVPPNEDIRDLRLKMVLTVNSITDRHPTAVISPTDSSGGR